MSPDEHEPDGLVPEEVEEITGLGRPELEPKGGARPVSRRPSRRLEPRVSATFGVRYGSLDDLDTRLDPPV